LKEKNMPVASIETPGRHAWMVWHDNLIHFAPLLFQDKQQDKQQDKEQDQSSTPSSRG
jgi:hypothetical protein